MKCVADGDNAKLIGRTIQSLARIGPELYLEVSSRGFSLKTVNSTRTAYAMIRFLPDFFSEFEYDRKIGQEWCKVGFRAILVAFKCTYQVESCTISLEPPSDKLMVILNCKMDITKTFAVSILALENLEAPHIPKDSMNEVTAPFKLFHVISHNFQRKGEELTFYAKKRRLIVKNYVENAMVDRRFMRSEISFKTNEFHKYLIKNETHVSFTMREFKAFLALSENTNSDLTIYFEKTGQPMSLLVDNPDVFEATLILSTLQPEDVSADESSETPEVIPEINSVATNQNKESTESGIQRAIPNSRKRKHLQSASTVDDQVESCPFGPSRNTAASMDTVRGKQASREDEIEDLLFENHQLADQIAGNLPLFGPQNDEDKRSEGPNMILVDTECPKQKRTHNQSTQSQAGKRRNSASERSINAHGQEVASNLGSVIPVSGQQRSEQNLIQTNISSSSTDISLGLMANLDSVELTNSDDDLYDRPQLKKVFSRCFNTTHNLQQQRPNFILAPNSDDES